MFLIFFQFISKQDLMIFRESNDKCSSRNLKKKEKIISIYLVLIAERALNVKKMFAIVTVEITIFKVLGEPNFLVAWNAGVL